MIGKPRQTLLFQPRCCYHTKFIAKPVPSYLQSPRIILSSGNSSFMASSEVAPDRIMSFCSNIGINFARTSREERLRVFNRQCGELENSRSQRSWRWSAEQQSWVSPKTLAFTRRFRTLPSCQPKRHLSRAFYLNFFNLARNMHTV